MKPGSQISRPLLFPLSPPILLTLLGYGVITIAVACWACLEPVTLARLLGTRPTSFFGWTDLRPRSFRLYFPELRLVGIGPAQHIGLILLQFGVQVCTCTLVDYTTTTVGLLVAFLPAVLTVVVLVGMGWLSMGVLCMPICHTALCVILLCQYSRVRRRHEKLA